MLLDDLKTTPDNEIIEKGARALINELGYIGYIKFMRIFEHGEGDYLKIQDEIYKDMSIREIADKAAEHCIFGDIYLGTFLNIVGTPHFQKRRMNN